MSTRRDFDGMAAAWLAEGPSELADRVLDAALREVHTTNQRRHLSVLPWRTSTMNTPQRVAAGIAIVAIVGFGILAFNSRVPSVGTTTPAPTVTAPPATQLPASALVPFTSAQYGYTISLPKGWGAQAAIRTLHGTEPLFGNEPEVGTPAGDSIMGGLFGQDAAALGRLLIAGGAMPAGTTLESWTADTALVKCGAPTSKAAITIDGEAATLSTYASCAGLFMQWVTVLHGGWAWHILWLDNQGSESTDVVVFEQLLATFRFGQLPAPSPGPS
jgi:hypothetical protein